VQLSELLSLPAMDPDQRRLGTVVDVRLAVAGDPENDPDTPTLAGLLISPRTTSSYLGYERANSGQPSALAALLRWRHRATFLAVWSDIAWLGPDSVGLRRGYRTYSPVLPD
jgi:hypothetical protein